MCGIVGIIGQTPVAGRIISGLKRLEYRGYDSAGIATLYEGAIHRVRATGKLHALQEVLDQSPLPGTIGIGHTRWATHGAPTTSNAHPHGSKSVSLVHNGIIENFQTLKAQLEAEGHAFESETDTEVVVHLIESLLKKGLSPEESFKQSLSHLRGSFAIVAIFASVPDHLFIARYGGSPLAIGYGEDEMYTGSDAIALVGLTNRLAYLEEGDYAILTPQGALIYDREHHPVIRPIKTSTLTEAGVSKKHYRHFMLKEIHEQPLVLQNTFDSLASQEGIVDFPVLDVMKADRMSITACGTAYYAGFVGKYWIEKLARLSVEVDIASEFRYREAPLTPGNLAMFVSQSGETVDTMAALTYANSQSQHIISVVNVPESAIDRHSHTTLLTRAGVEIGVASTKAFTSQLMVLALFSLYSAFQRGHLSKEQMSAYCTELSVLPLQIQKILDQENVLQKVSSKLASARDVIFLGRGIQYPIALEGALKLKEISYIHAEGYAAGELKHGPIALIDEHVPVICLAPFDASFEKMVSNMQEVAARGASLVILTDVKGAAHLGNLSGEVIVLPESTFLTSPFIYTVPLQLLAYHTALLKGTDVDQPRNLAKSVTVE